MRCQSLVRTQRKALISLLWSWNSNPPPLLLFATHWWTEILSLGKGQQRVRKSSSRLENEHLSTTVWGPCLTTPKAQWFFYGQNILKHLLFLWLLSLLLLFLLLLWWWCMSTMCMLRACVWRPKAVTDGTVVTVALEINLQMVVTNDMHSENWTWPLWKSDLCSCH